jgi:phenylacetate-coenzyme A ligase PaaK-like adenylate-forming protein
LKITPLENWILDRTGIQTKSREALEEYQMEQLKSVINYVKQKSRHYQRKLEAINPDSINSFKEFADIPFTFPEDIKKNSLDFLCVSQKEINRIVTLNTSGTSGDEKRIYFTEEDLNHTIDFFQFGMKCLTDEEDRVLVLLPGNAHGSIGNLLKKALALSNVPCMIHGVLTDLEEVEQCIEKNKITCIVGIPMQVLYLSRTKSEVFRKHIKKVLLSTDYVPDVLVKELKNRFHCDVYNHYGMTEMGYGGGVECEALHGYHLREADLYFEIVNPETGEVVRDGQYGEVVFTTLNRQAMPLIRYRTGDMARFITTSCACGTFLRTMDKVTERIANKVVLNDTNEIHLRDLDEIVLILPEIVDYHASIADDNRLVLEIITGESNYNGFDCMKDEIAALITERFCFPLNLEINWMPDDRTPKITNSMIKRKIYDFRKGDV